MRVLSDKHSEVVRHFRTIELEDGPLVDCGAGPSASYNPGTIIRAEKLKLEWINDKEPETVLVSGPYQGLTSGRAEYNVRYRLKDGLPDWIKEILQ